MTDEPQYYKPAFRLRLLGYSRRDVAVAFAEGRMALHQLRAQAVTLTEQVAKLDREVERMRAELDATRAREHELQRLTIAAEQKAAAIEDGARGRAREIVAEGEERAALTRGEASLRAEEVSRQIDELLHVREQLVRSARGAAQRLEDAVSRIERGEVDEPTEAERPQATAPPPEHAPAVAAAAQRARGDERIFETTVELDAGPFADFAELSAFERALGRMAKTQDVYIRRFADERATIEVTLVEAAPLIDLLGDVLPHGFDVVASTERTLKIPVVAALPSLGSR